MLPNDFYSEKKWCPCCKQYVYYLMSLAHSYCVTCGSKVTLFNRTDRKKFEESLVKNKYKAS